MGRRWPPVAYGFAPFLQRDLQLSWRGPGLAAGRRTRLHTNRPERGGKKRKKKREGIPSAFQPYSISSPRSTWNAPNEGGLGEKKKKKKKGGGKGRPGVAISTPAPSLSASIVPGGDQQTRTDKWGTPNKKKKKKKKEKKKKEESFESWPATSTPLCPASTLAWGEATRWEEKKKGEKGEKKGSIKRRRHIFRGRAVCATRPQAPRPCLGEKNGKKKKQKKKRKRGGKKIKR